MRLPGGRAGGVARGDRGPRAGGARERVRAGLPRAGRSSSRTCGRRHGRRSRERRARWTSTWVRAISAARVAALSVPVDRRVRRAGHARGPGVAAGVRGRGRRAHPGGRPHADLGDAGARGRGDLSAPIWAHLRRRTARPRARPAPGRTPPAARGRARPAARVAEEVARRRRRRRSGPPTRMTARSHSSAANGRSWVTTSIVWSASPSISSSSRRARGSRLADGSSSTSSSGRIASTVASATRRRCPSDSWCGARSARSRHPHGRERLVHPRVASRRVEPRFSGPKATSSRTVGMNSWSSGSWNTSPTRARSSRASPRPTAQPGHVELAGAGEQPVQVQHQRGLAGAVRPEHGDPLARARRPGRRRRAPTRPSG